MELFNPEVLRDLLHQLPDRSGVPLRELAVAAGKEYKTLSRELFPEDSGAKVGPDTLVYLCHRAQDFEALDYMESALNRVAFSLPQEPISARAILENLARTGKEMGEAISQVAGDMADGKLDDPEKAIKEVTEAAQALAMLRAVIVQAMKERQPDRLRAACPVNQ